MPEPSPSDTERSAFRRDVGAICCGLWFLLTGWMWAYLANLYLAFPIAIVGFFLWRSARRGAPPSRWNRVAGILLVVGMFSSLVALVLFR